MPLLRALIISSLTLGAIKAHAEAGYVFYAKTPFTVGTVEFSKDQPIFIQPKLGEAIPKPNGFVGEFQIKRMVDGQPIGDWLSGKIDSNVLGRTAPIAHQNPESWTVEPPQMNSMIAEMKSLPGTSAPGTCAAPSENPDAAKACPSGNSECLAVASAVSEFQNSELCDEINRSATPTPSRKDQLLTAWQKFIDMKSGGSCKPTSTEDNCTVLNRARDVDLMDRTAVFEAEQADKSQPDGGAARHECEEDYILLALRNRALDPLCGGSQKTGCTYVGDFTGAATKPSEINIWFPKESLTTRITGCFMRKDADVVTWPQSAQIKNPENAKKAFIDRRQDYLNTFERAMQLTSPTVHLENVFNVQKDGKDLSAQDQNKLLTGTTAYYHPTGMETCDPKTYDSTAFVSLGYAKAADGTYLVSGLRVTPETSGPDGTQIKDVYQLEKRTKVLGSNEDWAPIYKSISGSTIATPSVDRSMNNTCWPSAQSGCAVDAKVGYRKAPVWATDLQNTHLGLSCKSRRNPSQTTWSFNGSCDPRMVIIPITK